MLTPTCSPTRGVREARVAPTLPLPSPNAFEAERGQVTTKGQRNHGRGTSVPILRPLTRCPLAARSPDALSRSPRFHSQPSQWQGMEQASFYQGAPRSHGEHPFPYDPLLFPYADAYTHQQQGGPHTTRIPRERRTRVTERPSMPTVTT